LNCPVCSQPLIILELNEIEIDYCTNCFGIWLDEGELELMIGNSGQKETLLHSFKPAHKSSEKKIKCPVCGKKMDKIGCGKDGEIILDKCRKHHGLWFNKGELEKVVESGGLNQNRIADFLREMFFYNLNK
jgi:Zn-finger nucleic acid-binding protein